MQQQAMSSISAEQVYIRLYDEIKQREFLQTRVDVLEHFIQMKFPEHFAGEVGTVADPELNAIPIVYGEPQETFPDDEKDK